MLIIALVAAVIAAVLAFFLMRAMSKSQGAKALARFELPPDSDKESFMDPKTGKRYDKEAYQKYLSATLQGMTVPQLNNLAARADSSVWGDLMRQGAQAELNRRQSAAEEASAQSEEALEELEDEIAPFFWVEQAHGASVGLATNTELQSVCTALDLPGTGLGWEKLAKAYVRSRASSLQGKLEFDSQEDLFSVYCADEAALRKFIQGFRALCDDEEACAAVLREAQAL